MRRSQRLNNDRGSSVVEFARVAPLLIIVGLMVFQVVLALHVRATLAAAAGEGARVAALAGATPALAERRSREVLEGNLALGAVDEIRVTQAIREGLAVASVTVDARLPLVGLMGPVAMHVTGHAVQEVS